MSSIHVTNVKDASGNAALVTESGGVKTDKLTGISTAGSISVVGEGNSTTTNLQQGLAKVWCNLNGTGTAAITDSFNTGSFTDHGSGSYSVIATNAMSSVNYNKVSHSGDNSSSGGNVTIIGGQRGFSVTSTTVKLAASYHADDATLADHGDVNVTYFGDLA